MDVFSQTVTQVTPRVADCLPGDSTQDKCVLLQHRLVQFFPGIQVKEMEIQDPGNPRLALAPFLGLSGPWEEIVSAHGVLGEWTSQEELKQQLIEHGILPTSSDGSCAVEVQYVEMKMDDGVQAEKPHDVVDEPSTESRLPPSQNDHEASFAFKLSCDSIVKDKETIQSEEQTDDKTEGVAATYGGVSDDEDNFATDEFSVTEHDCIEKDISAAKTGTATPEDKVGQRQLDIDEEMIEDRPPGSVRRSDRRSKGKTRKYSGEITTPLKRCRKDDVKEENTSDCVITAEKKVKKNHKKSTLESMESAIRSGNIQELLSCVEACSVVLKKTDVPLDKIPPMKAESDIKQEKVETTPDGELNSAKTITVVSNEVDKKGTSKQLHAECQQFIVFRDSEHCCVKCDYRNTNGVLTRMHVRRHHFPKPYKCTGCDRAFGIAKDLTRHVKIHDKPPKHGDKREAAVSGAAGVQSLESAEASKVNLKQTTSRSSKMVSKIAGKRATWNCKALRSEYDQLIEMRDSYYHCLNCSYKSANRVLSTLHVRRHHFSKNFKCTICVDKAFAIEKDFNRHMKLHDPEFTLPCKLCDLLFPSDGKLRYHILKAHQQPQSQVKQTPKEKIFMCNQCNFSTAQSIWLEHHVQRQHMDRNIQCPRCDKRFGLEKSLKEHIQRSHENNKFTCETCGHSLSSKAGLEFHIQRRHKGLKVDRMNRYICDQCGKVCVGRTEYTNHINRHTGIRPFKCKVCHKSFHGKTPLRTHMKIHMVRRHQCTQCDKFFIRSSDVKRHMNMHLPVLERPHACIMCDKRFSRKDHLRDHCLKQHGETLFRCGVCEEVFLDQFLLQHHIDSAHGQVSTPIVVAPH